MGLGGPPITDLTRAREELRAAQVRYAEQAEVVQAALDAPVGSLREGIRALPEPRLRALEAEQRRRLKSTRAQLLVVRSELDELGADLPPLEIAGVSSASLWLPAGIAAASRRAVGHAALAVDTPAWLRLAQLEPASPDARKETVRLGRHGRALWDRALAALDRDDTQGAIEFMRRIERYQTLSHAQSRALAKALVTRAVGKAGIGDYEAAARDASLAIRRDPECAWAYSHRGYCRRRLGRLEEATQDLLEAKRLGSPEASGQLAGLAEVYTQRAWERNRLQNTEGAVEDWRSAWQIEKELRGDQ
jgi:tetratricopeptide (TPR) repeat protein